MIVGKKYTVNWRHADGSLTDGNGRTTPNWRPGTDREQRVAAMANFAEQALAGQDGAQFDAVVLLPIGSLVTPLDEFDIENGPMPLRGTYKVSVVRDTILHLRVLLRRHRP